jgi:cell division protease FtsH
MSDELGPISYGSDTGIKDMIYLAPGEKEYSEKTAEAIDREIKRITDEAYKKAKELIESNKDKLERIAKALLKYETLDASDVKLILEGGELDKPTVGDLLAAEQAKSEQQKSKPDKQQEQSKG